MLSLDDVMISGDYFLSCKVTTRTILICVDIGVEVM
jgi:hypothetical protein